MLISRVFVKKYFYISKQLQKSCFAPSAIIVLVHPNICKHGSLCPLSCHLASILPLFPPNALASIVLHFFQIFVQRLPGDLELSGHFGANSISDGINTTTPMGRFFFNIMGSLAQMERELIVERTRAGLQAARDRGRVGGANGPFQNRNWKPLKSSSMRVHPGKMWPRL